MPDRVKVVVGVIEHPESGKILIAKRKANQHLSGFWEFPGGKINANELATDALNRELSEELGIEVSASYPLTQIEHDYQDKQVLLDVWHVTNWHGTASGRENQEVQWVSKNQLLSYDFPEANRSILIKLLLPDICTITPALVNDLSEFTSVVKLCLETGVNMIVLRLSDDSDVSETKCITAIREQDIDNNLKIIVNNSINKVDFKYVNGVHLKSRNLFNYIERPIDTQYLLGASCHNVEEIEQAIKIDADYLFISPIKKTLSHPEAEPMGWDEFRKLCELTHKPVFALGGMKPEDINTAKNEGAHGIAVLNEIWNSRDFFLRKKAAISD